MIDWEKIKEALKREIDDVAFESWVSPISLGSVNNGIAELFVPTKFMQEWIERHYYNVIKRTIKEQSADSITDISFGVRPFPMARPQQPQARASEPSLPLFDLPETREADGKQSNDLFNYYLDPKYTFDQFIVGSPNEFAYGAALKAVKDKGMSYNPLYLYSGSGLGKTHLMHAIAWKIKEETPERKVIYLSAEKFMYHFVNALRFKDIFSFKDKFRSVDVLMIDDIQFLVGKATTQEEFFHTFNSLVGQGKQLILSADTAPQNLEGIEERLKTRMTAGLVADIHPTNYELRYKILAAKAKAMNADVPKEVLEFLADLITTNVRELEGALRRVATHAELIGIPISLERTKEILKDTIGIYNKKVTIDEIQKKVSDHFKIKVSEMQSKRREREVARPRQIAMYLAKQMTTRSLPEIGKKFDRDHTTVIHAVRTVEDLSKSNRTFADELNALRKKIQS